MLYSIRALGEEASRNINILHKIRLFYYVGDGIGMKTLIDIFDKVTLPQ